MKAGDDYLAPILHSLEKSTNYDKLIKEFGVEPIDKVLHKLKNPHKLFLLKFVFAHRDFDKLIGEHNKEKFAIVSGRGPSNYMHLGHLVVFDLNLWFQKKFGIHVYIPLSDDEKYVFRKVDTLEKAIKFAYSNALDIVALGYDPSKTHLFISSKVHEICNLSLKLSRYVTYNTVKAVFGFDGSENPGMIYYSVIQTAHILYPSYREGVRVLVPVAIDQDPYIRLSRDIAERVRLPKPCSIYLKYLRGPFGEPMSSSRPETSIFINEDFKSLKKKVWNMLTGGRETIEKHRKYGGIPEQCVVFEWLSIFVLNTKEVEKLREECRSGRILCGECKKMLIEGLAKFIEEHRKKREKAKNYIDKYFIHEIDYDVIQDL